MNCSSCRSVSFDEIERSDMEVLNFCILCTTASKSFFQNFNLKFNFKIYLTFSVNFHMFKAKAFQIGKKIPYFEET